MKEQLLNPPKISLPELLPAIALFLASTSRISDGVSLTEKFTTFNFDLSKVLPYPTSLESKISPEFSKASEEFHAGVVITQDALNAIIAKIGEVKPIKIRSILS